jgi:phage baseplate assembly protein W
MKSTKERVVTKATRSVLVLWEFRVKIGKIDARAEGKLVGWYVNGR